jgi:hypothetical protein
VSAGAARRWFLDRENSRYLDREAVGENKVALAEEQLLSVVSGGFDAGGRNFSMETTVLSG